MERRTFLAATSVFAVLGPATFSATREPAQSWPEWHRFADRFVQADGRVIDLTFDAKSTSEGQSYGLFFALVANRRDQFDAILNWTSANLADSELGAKLPGWLWGKHDNGHWGIKDRNAASDADLWIAYSLLEGGRLWQEPRYTSLGKKMLSLIVAQEVAEVGAAGMHLLPGPVGFELSGRRVRINPSYLPEFMFAYFASVDPKGPWDAMWKSYLRLAPKIFIAGVAPDLVVVDRQSKVFQDTERAPGGSYDAIRVYLWAGMSASPDRNEVLRFLTPYVNVIRTLGTPPENVNPANGEILKADFSPLAFSGAVLPFLSALSERELLERQTDRLQTAAMRAKLGATTHYYDQVLILFGKGWLDGYYRFDAQGRLQPKWAGGGS